MLALGTDNGVILYSIPKNSFQQIDIRTATQTSNDVESVYQDHLGDIWIFYDADKEYLRISVF